MWGQGHQRVNKKYLNCILGVDLALNPTGANTNTPVIALGIELRSTAPGLGVDPMDPTPGLGVDLVDTAPGLGVDTTGAATRELVAPGLRGRCSSDVHVPGRT